MLGTKDDKKLQEAQQPQTLSVQCFEHKGEVVITFSQPVQQWFLLPEGAIKFSEAFAEMAKSITSQALAGMTKQ